MDEQKTPNMPVEVFLSMFKWFSVIFLIAFLACAGLFYTYIKGSFHSRMGSTIEMTQDGEYNNQAMTNG